MPTLGQVDPRIQQLRDMMARQQAITQSAQAVQAPPPPPRQHAPSTNLTRPLPDDYAEQQRTRYYTDPITGEQTDRRYYPDVVTARTNTARQLNLLQQMMGRQQQRSIGGLRSQLAQRGLLDSGSLGAGISRIASDTGNVLAEGTQYHALNEAEALARLMRDQTERDFQRQQSERAISAQRALQEMQQRFAASQQAALLAAQPSGLEQLLAGIGGGVGQGLPFFLLSRGQRGGQGSGA